MNNIFKNKSPFDYYANATLSLSLMKPYISDNLNKPLTDSYNQPIIEYEKIDIRCLLREKNSPSSDSFSGDVYPGVNQHSLYLEGWLVDPLTYPPSLKFPAIADIVIELSGLPQKGKFTILPFMKDPFLAKENIDFITDIRGLLSY